MTTFDTLYEPRTTGILLSISRLDLLLCMIRLCTTTHYWRCINDYFILLTQATLHDSEIPETPPFRESERRAWDYQVRDGVPPRDALNTHHANRLQRNVRKVVLTKARTCMHELGQVRIYNYVSSQMVTGLIRIRQSPSSQGPCPSRTLSRWASSAAAAPAPRTRCPASASAAPRTRARSVGPRTPSAPSRCPSLPAP